MVTLVMHRFELMKRQQSDAQGFPLECNETSSSDAAGPRGSLLEFLREFTVQFPYLCAPGFPQYTPYCCTHGNAIQMHSLVHCETP